MDSLSVPTSWNPRTPMFIMTKVPEGFNTTASEVKSAGAEESEAEFDRDL